MKEYFDNLKIRHILILSFLSLSLIPLLLLSTMIYQYSKSILVTSMTNSLEAITDRQADQIRSYIREKELNVRTLSQSPYIAETIVKLEKAFRTSGLDSKEYQEASRAFETYIKFYLSEAQFDDIFLIATDGTVIFSAQKGEDLGSNYRTGIYQDTELAKVFDRTTMLLDTQISDYAYYPATNEPALFIGSPILRQEGVLGALVLQLNNEEIYKIVNNYIGLQSTGETLIVAESGDYMTYFTPTRFDPYAAFKRKISLGSKEGEFFEKVIRGRNQKGIIEDYRKEKVLAVGKYFLPELGWGMIVKIDTNELFAPINSMKWLAAVIAFFTIGAVMIAAYLIAQLIARPIIYLMQKANLIAAGNLSESIDLPSKNEIGKLAFSFNEMTRKLRNIIEHLDELVKERTEELSKAQDRLITQEKLASLGALTAGIAHEIKNPLNFVNNFSALSLDLIDELKKSIAAVTKLKTDEEDQFATLKQNIKSVVEQGKKADNIVQRMLSHSRAGTGIFSPTDINQLLLDYLELSFHGTSALEDGCEVKINKHLDRSLEKIDVISEDIGRVFLNLLNNAFYAVHKKSKFDPSYRPVISVETKNLDKEVEIRIKDNGIGMPPQVAKQLFTPFFTTKPPGEGTGLGLSLSYNIIAQEHGGTMDFTTEDGEFTEFIIHLPKPPLK